jgi:hypothetical protein
MKLKTDFSKWYLLLAAMLVLTGCSAARLAYNNASSLAAWYLSDYVDFNEEQTLALKGKLDNFFVWHRKIELPQVQRLLKDMGDKLDRDVTNEDIANIYKATRARYEAATLRALPDTVAVLSTLNEEQIAQIERKFAKDNAKRAKALAKPAAMRLTKRGERMQKEAKEWCGKLSEQQLLILKEFNSQLSDIEGALDADLRFRQQEFLRLLRTHRTKDTAVTAVALASTESSAQLALEKGLRRILFEQTSWRKAELQAELKAREALASEMMVQFYKTMSPQQRAVARHRIAGYLDDVTALIANP